MANVWESGGGVAMEGLSRKERTEASGGYRRVDKLVEAFEQKRLTSQELADQLGERVWNVDGEGSQTSIYAFKRLLKTQGRVEGIEDAKVLAREALFCIAVEQDPRKKVVLLGMLRYFTDLDRLLEIPEKIPKGERDGKTRIEINIIANLNKAILEIGRQDWKLDPEMKQIAQYVKGGFSGEEQGCRLAKEIADFWEKEGVEPGGLKMKLSRLGNKGGAEWTGLQGSGLPRYAYILPKGHHPSREKLEEMDHLRAVGNNNPERFKGLDLELNPLAAIEEGDGNFLLVEYDLNPKLSRLYLKNIRRHKDGGDKKRVQQLEAALKERIWRDIEKYDPSTAEKLGSKDKLIIFKKTIRDYPIDKELESELLESELKVLDEEGATAAGS